MAALVYVFEVSIITFIVLMTAKVQRFFETTKCLCHFFIFYCKKQRMALQRCSVAALQGENVGFVEEVLDYLTRYKYIYIYI